MKNVRLQYNLLQGVIDELGDKISGVLAQQEGEFLGAYRTHMRSVQRDFQSLKEDIEAKESAISNNTKVKQLEKERDWYKKEALHLDKVLSSTKNREQELEERLEELEEDRNWLANQLKIVMKQKNILEKQLAEAMNKDVS
mmetsp:Transcript_32743/g.48078  ORF Transcript_32743/g.48078 Transcript_32743/m.48078 type:complete len:141 (+) Transcript_32743:619-1041(+)